MGLLDGLFGGGDTSQTSSPFGEDFGNRLNAMFLAMASTPPGGQGGIPLIQATNLVNSMGNKQQERDAWAYMLKQNGLPPNLALNPAVAKYALEQKQIKDSQAAVGGLLKGMPGLDAPAAASPPAMPQIAPQSAPQATPPAVDMLSPQPMSGAMPAMQPPVMPPVMPPKAPEGLTPPQPMNLGQAPQDAAPSPQPAPQGSPQTAPPTASFAPVDAPQPTIQQIAVARNVAPKSPPPPAAPPGAPPQVNRAFAVRQAQWGLSAMGAGLMLPNHDQGKMLQELGKAQIDLAKVYLTPTELQKNIDSLNVPQEVKQQLMVGNLDKRPTDIREYEYGQSAPGFYDYQERMKKAGAINMGENSFAKGLGESAAKNVNDTFGAAKDSVGLLNVINNGKQLLNEGAITGAGANWRVNAVKWAGLVLGQTVPQETANNSETFKSVMGQAVGKIIKQFGSGTGLSDADRKYAERIAGGDIELNEQAIRRILDMGEKTAVNNINNWQEMQKRLPPEFSKFYKLPEPMSIPAQQAAPGAAPGNAVDWRTYFGVKQ